jgi:hypothetical protein
LWETPDTENELIKRQRLGGRLSKEEARHRLEQLRGVEGVASGHCADAGSPLSALDGHQLASSEVVQEEMELLSRIFLQDIRAIGSGVDGDRHGSGRLKRVRLNPKRTWRSRQLGGHRLRRKWSRRGWAADPATSGYRPGDLHS